MQPRHVFQFSSQPLCQAHQTFKIKLFQDNRQQIGLLFKMESACAGGKYIEYRGFLSNHLSQVFDFTFIVPTLRRMFLGPRGPLIEPLSVPSTRPPATIFPEFIDELRQCRQASGTTQTIHILKVHDVSYPNSDKNSNTETNTKTNTETNKGSS